MILLYVVVGLRGTLSWTLIGQQAISAEFQRMALAPTVVQSP